MTRTETIAHIQACLGELADEQLSVLADLAESWTGETPPEEDHTHRAIAEGLAEARRGEAASADAVKAVLDQPWR